jgi:hypothetical protein
MSPLSQDIPMYAADCCGDVKELQKKTDLIGVPGEVPGQELDRSLSPRLENSTSVPYPEFDESVVSI